MGKTKVCAWDHGSILVEEGTEIIWNGISYLYDWDPLTLVRQYLTTSFNPFPTRGLEMPHTLLNQPTAIHLSLAHFSTTNTAEGKDWTSIRDVLLNLWVKYSPSAKISQIPQYRTSLPMRQWLPTPNQINISLLMTPIPAKASSSHRVRLSLSSSIGPHLSLN